MIAPRYLLVIADDFGIGPETSRGILELAARGVVTGSVLLVNSPHAEGGVHLWNQSGRRLELGWHPSLTLDPPMAPLSRVPSLVGPDGCLWPLPSFLSRLYRGLIRPAEVELELRAQLARFIDLVGHLPTLVNSHQHTSLFPPVGNILRAVLAGAGVRPYFRRVREPWSMLFRIPGARIKRLALTLMGRAESRRQREQGFPGPEWLAGVTDPPQVTDPRFFVNWLTKIPGRDVEVACHPGHHDDTLLGRDATPEDGLVQRRVDEYRLLSDPSFLAACHDAGFQLIAPAEWLARRLRGARHAA